MRNQQPRSIIHTQLSTRFNSPWTRPTMDLKQVSIAQPQKPHLIDSLHFAFAGVVTCIYLALEIGGSIAAPAWHPEAADWLFFGAAAASVLFSGFWSIRQIKRGNQMAWVFVIGDCLYALVIAAVFSLFVSMLLIHY
jgi:hypothetical protein